ncbi:DNA phosphorothioation system sulfurtransferase DndC [Oceanobacillus luteolus]|uniref:DNA phosphorothioation system sulfurtransferase DndC n=1 Tax=Oceanobacillus luteolus TaxID=1274358 RepID=UPI00203D4158|nr:DNA phosphorothioation system sulfurtransferase DndC [Oceanobacillus luteolus]MCM3741911.1 DNA phosphorothioation system sulfurtransferase DndC [Oceanobacillus luteolus]
MSIISNLFNDQVTLIEDAKEEIRKVYLEDDRPWVVGYSGGKDSTVVIQLVYEALKELSSEQLNKKIYVISSDTLVETPLIIQSINTTLRRIEEKAIEDNLPIETHKVKPMIEQSFWTNIIGKGYPSPNQQFRWCTDRMKIDPANQFIMDKVNSFGEVIMLLGVREQESATRANVIKSHSTEGKLLMRHSTLTNAYVYAPIKKFSVDDVWNYLLNHESPWGDDNYELYRLYSDSNSGECPLVVDKTIKEAAGSCGNSRFGCWVCTVVNEDKALTGFINNGHDWMKPLLNFRNWLSSIRDDRSMRMKYRMNGQVYYLQVQIIEHNGEDCILIPKKGDRKREFIPVTEFEIIDQAELKTYLKENNIDLSTSDDPNILIRDSEDNYYRLGLGPFTLEARKEILTRLLKVQKNLKHPHDESYQLIQEDELKEIRKIWFNNGDFEDSLPMIYYDIFGYDLDWEKDDRLLFDRDDLTQLELMCEEEGLDYRLMKRLLLIEKEHSEFKMKRGLMDQLSSALNQDYLHL